MISTPLKPRDDDLAAWCEQHLGARPSDVMWTSGHLSWVGGLRLADEREVVVKIRSADPALPGCHAVHLHLWRAGFPCPEPLTSVLPFGELVASAEVHLPGGEPGRADEADLCERTAAELARLIALAPRVNEVPSLDPPRAWAGWSDRRAAPWPPPDEGADLNDHPATEELRPLAFALNERLNGSGLKPVVGHVDWYQGNLRWIDGVLVSADDWDSISALPEAALVGCAAASYLPGGDAADPSSMSPGAEAHDAFRFIEAYGHASGRALDAAEIEVAFAAGLWQRVFDAAKLRAAGKPELAQRQIRDSGEWQHRAGI